MVSLLWKDLSVAGAWEPEPNKIAGFVAGNEGAESWSTEVTRTATLQSAERPGVGDSTQIHHYDSWHLATFSICNYELQGISCYNGEALLEDWREGFRMINAEVKQRQLGVTRLLIQRMQKSFQTW